MSDKFVIKSSTTSLFQKSSVTEFCFIDLNVILKCIFASLLCQKEITIAQVLDEVIESLTLFSMYKQMQYTGIQLCKFNISKVFMYVSYIIAQYTNS